MKLPGGNNLLNSVILQAPSVTQDILGQVHIRGEHNALQYRLNGVIIPEGISVFGQTLDPRLASSVKLIDGALPAEYGLVTGAIVDMQTKSGVFDSGGDVSIYGGSHQHHRRPSITAVTPDTSTILFPAISPATIWASNRRTAAAIRCHDRTTQYHGFAYLEDILDDHSRITAMLGTSNAIFEIPNQVGCSPPGWTASSGWGRRIAGSGNFLSMPTAQPDFRRENLDESQREITHYGILSYLHRAGPLDFQVSAFGRYSSLFSRRDVGDILYNGIAQTAYKRDVAYGLQAEGAWHAWARPHDPLRRGVSGRRYAVAHRVAGAAGRFRRRRQSQPQFALRRSGPDRQTSAMPLTVIDNGASMAIITVSMCRMNGRLPTLTINYGLRYDAYTAFDAENQLSPAHQCGVEPDRHDNHSCRLFAFFLAAAIRTGRKPECGAVRQHHGRGGSH